MAKSKIISSIVIAIGAMMLTGCSFFTSSPDSTENDAWTNMPKALFIYIHYYGSGTEVVNYIDSAGNVYNMEVNKDEQLDLQGIYEKINVSKDKKIDKVDEEQLKSNYQLLLQIPRESVEDKNLIYTESFNDVVLGYHEWYGVRYDKKVELEYIILAGEGDTAIENQDEDAQKIASWLRGILFNKKGISFN